MRLFRSVFILLVFPLLAGTLYAKRPWGVLRYPIQDDTLSVYAIDNLLDERPIRYALAENITPKEENIFTANMQKWPAETLRFIQKSGRTQEFQDIIPILKRNVELQAVPLSTPPDIYVNIITNREDCGSSTAAGCFDVKGEENSYSSILVLKDYRIDFEGISLHEIGHYFGLADQYTEAIRNSHREYSSPVNTKDKAIMQGHLETNGQITCDDADGFINLLDLRYSQRNSGQFSKRAKKGWASLCPNSPNIYKNAKTFNRPALGVREDDEISLIITEYKEGSFQQEGRVTFPDDPLSIFTFTPGKDKVQREKNSPFIRAIYKTMQATMVSADGQYAPKQVSYKTTFSYGKPFTQNGKKAVTISVREFLEEKEIKSHKVVVLQDGEVTGIPRLQLESDLYIAKASNHKILLSFRNGISGDFSCQLHEMHEKIWESHGNTGHMTAHGKTQTISLPPPPNSRAERYWEICQERKKALDDFYKNFYAPLFNTNQRQDAQSQVKRALQRG